MGGLIAALVAHENQERVSSLAFLGSPSGVAEVQQSEMSKVSKAGKSPLIVENEKQYWDRFDWLEKQVSPLALFAGTGFVEKELAIASLNHRIWREVSKTNSSLLSKMAPTIDVPTLVLWCREDRVFDISAAEPFLKLLPKGHMHIMEGCGHAPILNPDSKTMDHYAWALDHVRNQIWPPWHAQ